MSKLEVINKGHIMYLIGGGGGVSRWRIFFHKKLHYTLIIILKLFELLKYEMQSQL